MKTSGKISIVIIALAIAVGIIYKLADVKRDKKEDLVLVNRSVQEVPVTVVTARYSEVVRDISCPGTFEPYYEVTVVSETQGKVKEYSVEEGVFISEGDIIARVDNDILSCQLEAAEAAYQKARRDLQRFENLTPGEAVSTQQLEEAGLASVAAKSTYLTLKKQYDDTFIRAPVAGTVSNRFIEKGTFIAPGAPVATIIDTRTMKFVAWFSAADLVRISTGQKVQITTDLYPELSYEGIITVTGITPDASRRYRVQAEIRNNLRQPLIPGTDGMLTLSLQQDRKHIIIPRNCIAGSIIEPVVYVVENDTARTRRVVIAEIIDGKAFVAEGLDEGEQVVLSGQINLGDNTKVRISYNQKL